VKVGLHADAVAHAIPGGVGSYVRRLVDELLRDPDGFDLELVVSRSTRRLPDEWADARVRRMPLGLRALYMTWNFLGVPALKGFDVVHATGLIVPPARDAKLVATIHDDTVERFPELVPAPWGRLYRRGFRTALRDASVLCANSEATRWRLVDAYGVAADRIVVTPLAPVVTPGHPQVADVFDRCAIRAPYVLNVSTVEPRKNQPALVRGFAKARLVEHQLVIAGAPGWGSDATREAIDQTGTSSRVVLTGRVSDSELAALYARADAFAFPSVYEGFGMPLLEALAHGLPSLSSTDDALREVGGDAVLAVDASDDAELALGIIRICTDDDVRQLLRAAGPRRAAEYSWARTARATIGAWKAAVA
jgi:glycosyltransferase involved in cell wall biosynthesis